MLLAEIEIYRELYEWTCTSRRKIRASLARQRSQMATGVPDGTVILIRPYLQDELAWCGVLAIIVCAHSSGTD